MAEEVRRLRCIPTEAHYTATTRGPTTPPAGTDLTNAMMAVLLDVRPGPGRGPGDVWGRSCPVLALGAGDRGCALSGISNCTCPLGARPYTCLVQLKRKTILFT